MNYRHIYHAGNFADVIKHLTLISLLQHLRNQNTPFYVFDAFAGAGLYNLSSNESSKTKEYYNGINRIITHAGNKDQLLNEYVDLVQLFSNKNLMYPGSPLIISQYLRPQDKADFCELHTEDFVYLKFHLMKYKNCFAHNENAYSALSNILPPYEKKGLILLDPSFECVDEFSKCITFVEEVSKKYSSTLIMIWYPIKDYKKVSDFYSKIQGLGREALKIEFVLDDVNTTLKAAGIIVINPPGIQLILSNTLSYIKENIYHKSARFSINPMRHIIDKK